MRIDLHCHSLHSDGTHPAADVAELARQREVRLFCLTDHDSCEGYESTLGVFPKALCGVELSCVEEGRTTHLLVYKTPGSTTWSCMEEALLQQREVRRQRVFTIAERLAEEGAPFDASALLAKHEGTLGRPHVAQELVRLGHVKSRGEAFSRFLKDGGPGDVVVNRLSLAEGLALGQQAGGRMSLAHPHLYGQGAEAILRKHRGGGLTGLEVYYGPYKSKARQAWAALAESLDLVQTGGSDFHGETYPKVLRPGVDMPDLQVQRLLAWLELSPETLES